MLKGNVSIQKLSHTVHMSIFCTGNKQDDVKGIKKAATKYIYESIPVLTKIKLMN